MRGERSRESAPARARTLAAAAREIARALGAPARRTAVLAIVAGLGAPAASGGELIEALRAGDGDAALAVLERGPRPDEVEADGTTALHWAVHYDRIDVVRRLLQAGADPEAVNDYGATPMSEAAVVGRAELLALLLDAGADVDSPNADGQTALMVVARGGDVDAARLLLDRGADVNARERRKGQTALMWAAAQSRPAMVELLVARGAEIDARSNVYEWKRRVTAEPRRKFTPTGGFTALLYAARQGCVDCARILVDAGADLDLPDPDGVTPLLMALLNASFDTARYLLEAGANVNKWDWWGRNPLYAAVDYHTLPHGGRPDRPSLDATSNLEMIGLLLAAGANPNAQLKLFPPYRSLRADRGADALLGVGTTPLLRAARAGDVPAMRLLLEHGALPDLPQQDGVTPLMAASGSGAGNNDTRGRFVTEAEARAAAALLLDAGARVGARDEQGRTALHGAAARGWTELARFLVAHGADPVAADAEGLTPIDAAMGLLRRRGGGDVHEETAAALRELAASR